MSNFLQSCVAGNQVSLQVYIGQLLGAQCMGTHRVEENKQKTRFRKNHSYHQSASLLNRSSPWKRLPFRSGSTRERCWTPPLSKIPFHAFLDLPHLCTALQISSYTDLKSKDEAIRLPLQKPGKRIKFLCGIWQDCLCVKSHAKVPKQFGSGLSLEQEALHMGLLVLSVRAMLL